jgi:hypothetical protein
LVKTNGLKITDSKKETFDKFMSEAKSKFSKLIKKEENKIKNPKDKNAPKRSKSAYIFCCTLKHDDVKDANPTMKPNDIMRELGKLWSEMTKNEKTEYEEMAVSDKERYEVEKKAYVPSLTSVKEEKVSKKAKTGFQIFCAEKKDDVKEENPDMNGNEIRKELSKMWKEVSKEEKLKYKEKGTESSDEEEEVEKKKDSKKKTKKSEDESDSSEDEKKKKSIAVASTQLDLEAT